MLTFSKTQVSEFETHYSTDVDTSLRYEQSFHQYFKLDKISSSDKDWCDKLYNVEFETARVMIKERTDQMQ